MPKKKKQPRKRKNPKANKRIHFSDEEIMRRMIEYSVYR